MFEITRLGRIAASLIISVALVSIPSITVADEDPTEVAAAFVDQKYFLQGSNVKRLFATRCSWCHQGYGMNGADGPRLAGTKTSRERVIETISRGKTPMPGFRKQLKEWQIESLADYIKALPDE